MFFYKNNMLINNICFNHTGNSLLKFKHQSLNFYNYRLRPIKIPLIVALNNEVTTRLVFSQPKLLRRGIKRPKKFDRKTFKIRRGRWHWRWWFKKSSFLKLSSDINTKYKF